jgi:hypothetical protein
MVATSILLQATLAHPCASRLLPRLEDKQKSCAIMHKLFHPHSLVKFLINRKFIYYFSDNIKKKYAIVSFS